MNLLQKALAITIAALPLDVVVSAETIVQSAVDEASVAMNEMDLLQSTQREWLAVGSGVVETTDIDGSEVTVYFGDNGRSSYREHVKQKLRSARTAISSAQGDSAKALSRQIEHLELELADLSASDNSNGQVKAFAIRSSQTPVCNGFFYAFSAFHAPRGHSQFFSSEAIIDVFPPNDALYGVAVSAAASAGGRHYFDGSYRFPEFGSGYWDQRLVSSAAPLGTDCSLDTVHRFWTLYSCPFWRTIQRFASCSGLNAGQGMGETIEDGQ